MTTTNKTTPFLELSAEEQELHRPALEDKAKSLGMTVHANTGTVSLYNRIQAKLDDLKEDEATAEEEAKQDLASIALVPQNELDLPPEYHIADRLVLAGENVRCIITPVDPIKRDWTGEVIEAGNDVTPVFKKMVPFGQEFHLPRAIVNVLQDKQYLHSKMVRNPQTGKEERKTRLIPAYNISILDNLSAAEIAAIADKQLAMARHSN